MPRGDSHLTSDLQDVDVAIKVGINEFCGAQPYNRAPVAVDSIREFVVLGPWGRFKADFQYSIHPQMQQASQHLALPDFEVAAQW
jgi:hypothetical protein